MGLKDGEDAGMLLSCHLMPTSRFLTRSRKEGIFSTLINNAYTDRQVCSPRPLTDLIGLCSLSDLLEHSHHGLVRALHTHTHTHTHVSA